MFWQVGFLLLGGPAIADALGHRRRAREAALLRHRALIAAIVALRDRCEPANDHDGAPPYVAFARGVRALQAGAA